MWGLELEPWPHDVVPSSAATLFPVFALSFYRWVCVSMENTNKETFANQPINAANRFHVPWSPNLRFIAFSGRVWVELGNSISLFFSQILPGGSVDVPGRGFNKLTTMHFDQLEGLEGMVD